MTRRIDVGTLALGLRLWVEAVGGSFLQLQNLSVFGAPLFSRRGAESCSSVGCILDIRGWGVLVRWS